MHHIITINGKKYYEEDIPHLHNIFEDLYGKGSFEVEAADFLKEWFDDNKLLKVHTSGSTGTPKELWVEKERMANSARLTISFLGLKEGNSALLCLPLKYIAGKMVIVRCYIGRMTVQTPVTLGRPLEHLVEIPDFAAMIPMQVYNSLSHERDKEKLKQIKHLIIGGGAIDENMEEELKSFPNAVWSTYGMTETLSHIALRRLNGEEASSWYTPFDNVKISLSEESTLIIHAPSVNPEVLVTNDIAEINTKGQFRIIGRKDNIINTGGVKVQIEKVEAELKLQMPDTSFMITSVKDKKYGEKIVMLTNGNADKQMISEAIASLPAYWRPKQILEYPELPLTETGKPDRANAKKIAETLSKKKTN